MCIAIYKPFGKHLSKRILRNCWENNNDGAGFMYAEDGRLVIRKEMDTFKGFWKKYQETIPDLRQMVLHFRISTSGEINKRNCHPHRINPKLAFVHNGIINIKEAKGLSDTVTFGKQVLSLLPEGFQDCSAHRYLLSLTIGYSKLVFMNAMDKVSIINEDAGSWDNNVWFSNTTYKSGRSFFSGYVGSPNTVYAKSGNGVGFNSATNPKSSVPTPYWAKKEEIKIEEKVDDKNSDTQELGAIEVINVDDPECQKCKFKLCTELEFEAGFCHYCIDKYNEGEEVNYAKKDSC